MTRTDPDITNIKRGRRVERGPYLHAFEWLEYTVDPDDDYVVHIRSELEPGRSYLVRRLCIEQKPGRPGAAPVSSEALRKMPLGAWSAKAMRLYGSVTSEEVAHTVGEASGAELRGRGIDDDKVLGLVAIDYQRALTSGQPPAQAVAELLDCSIATAGKWIAAAKDGGFLKVTSRRRR